MHEQEMLKEPKPPCNEPGCGKPSTWSSEKRGPKCAPHVPMVRAVVEIGKATVPCARVTCSECGYNDTTLEQGFVKPNLEDEQFMAPCPKCGVRCIIQRSKVRVY